jgi:hypothetical protein
MTEHRMGTAVEHLEARLALLEAEKEHTVRGDELARQRQALPWVPVEKEYVFDTDAASERCLRRSTGARSCSSTTLCSGPNGARDARSAPTGLTASTVALSTSPIGP